jgi:hypothetical protein
MLLRNHPLMRYRGIASWPPVWTWIGGGEKKRPRGEIGILRSVARPVFNLLTDVSYTSITKDHRMSAAF